MTLFYLCANSHPQEPTLSGIGACMPSSGTKLGMFVPVALLAAISTVSCSMLSPNRPERRTESSPARIFVEPIGEEGAEGVSEYISNNATRLLEAAVVFRRRGQFDQALEYLERAFELSPTEARLAGYIGDTLRLLRRHAQADRFFDIAISVAPDPEAASVGKMWNGLMWHGDAKEAASLLCDIPKKKDAHSIFIWQRQGLYERNYAAAVARLESVSFESYEDAAMFVPRTRALGFAYHLMGDADRAREAYEVARVVLERELETNSDDHRVQSSLGIVYAGLGRKADAIHMGELAVALCPITKHALIGQQRLEDLTRIYAWTEEHDAAMDKIEYLLSTPSDLSIPLLRLDPRWDPLRDRPRFKNLVRRRGRAPATRSIPSP